MTKCPLLGGCCFFNDICENMPACSGYLKDTYCKQKYTECARYYVYQNTKGEGVAPDLFPHEMDKASKEIREYRKNQANT